MATNAAATLLRDHDERRTAVVCGAEAMDYRTLVDAVARAAGAWRAAGLVPGERMAIRVADSIDWVVAYLGAIWAGGVAVGVNPRIPADDWAYVAAEGEFRFVLTADEVATNDTGTSATAIPLAAWRERLAAASPAAAEPMAEDAPCFWCHSSGSSGRPKAVVHAHRFAAGVERVAVELLGITRDDRVYASSKLFFAYPLGNSLFAGLKTGATVILDPEWPTAASVAATIRMHQPSVLFSVPALYRNMLKAGVAPALAGTLRTCVSAGEALPPALRDEWLKATGITLRNGFGASETLSLVLFNAGEGDALQAAPGASITPLTPGATGPTRVCIRGPMVALGYWRRPDAEAEHFRAGAFVPGDLFERTDDGRWRFAGREDSLVKINGRWVDLVALEERLTRTCHGIREGAVIAAPDGDGVAAIAFYYAPRAEVETCAAECLARFAEGLPHYQRPRWIRELPALPRTPTGKLLRRKLLEMHGRAGAGAPPPP